MNKLIEELAKQAGWGKGETYDDCMQCSPFDPEIFAELIILECAEMFEGVYTDEHPGRRIDTRIKQHFGVK